MFDLRSPGEFAQGHIPGSVNLPLLSDDERALIGTLYKQEGRQAAITAGMELFRIDAFDEIEAGSTIYCWRGGMRSGIVAQLLATFGKKVHLLPRGYKGWRATARRQFSRPRDWRVLGGKTGCGKTDYLRQCNGQVLDLEALANHRGSSYGAIGMPPQPSQEQFENLIAHTLAGFDSRPVWVEDESRMIGKCRIPDLLFLQMRTAPATIIENTLDERLDRLMTDYGNAPVDELIAATERIRKKLGGERCQTAIGHLNQGNLRQAFTTILDYYDRTYSYGLRQRLEVA